MLKLVWFHIHGKSPEKTVNIMTKVLKKLKYIKVNLIDNKCIIQTEYVPDSFNSWLIDKIINSKKFMGKFHNLKLTPELANKISKAQIKIQTCISRFGFWDSVDYPEDQVFGDFLIRKTQCLLNNIPLWKAVKIASKQSKHEISKPEGEFAYSLKMDYIENLVKYHKLTKSEAENIINREFPYLTNVEKPEKTKVTKEVMETINRKTNELIETLRFYSPKNRKKYLEETNNFDKFLIFAALFHKKGRDWVIENIGEVESWT